jgi:hypothetical protein
MHEFRGVSLFFNFSPSERGTSLKVMLPMFSSHLIGNFSAEEDRNFLQWSKQIGRKQQQRPERKRRRRDRQSGAQKGDAAACILLCRWRVAIQIWIARSQK